MTLGKITNDNSVKYIPKSEQTKEKVNKPNTIKNCKENKNISQNNKEMITDVIK